MRYVLFQLHRGGIRVLGDGGSLLGKSKNG